MKTELIRETRSGEQKGKVWLLGIREVISPYIQHADT